MSYYFKWLTVKSLLRLNSIPHSIWWISVMKSQMSLFSPKDNSRFFISFFCFKALNKSCCETVKALHTWHLNVIMPFKEKSCNIDYTWVYISKLLYESKRNKHKQIAYVLVSPEAESSMILGTDVYFSNKKRQSERYRYSPTVHWDH